MTPPYCSRSSETVFLCVQEEDKSSSMITQLFFLLPTPETSLREDLGNLIPLRKEAQGMLHLFLLKSHSISPGQQIQEKEGDLRNGTELG